MRKYLAVLVLAVLAGGCAGDVAGPEDSAFASQLEEMAGMAYGAMHVGDPTPAPGIMPRLARLPAGLALTDAQVASIRALVDAFVAATAADREALAAIHQQALQARQAGRPPEEVRAIMAAGADIRRTLHEAERALHAAVLAVLTPEQRAWLANHPPRQPPACTLTEAQRAEISGLMAAFEEANAADIALVRAVHERARAAHQAGATREQVQAILNEARQAMERLRVARQALHREIQAVLTPQQRVAGCFR